MQEARRELGDNVPRGEPSLAPDVFLALSRCSGNVHSLKRPMSISNWRLKEDTDPREGATTGKRRLLSRRSAVRVQMHQPEKCISWRAGGVTLSSEVSGELRQTAAWSGACCVWSPSCQAERAAFWGRGEHQGTHPREALHGPHTSHQSLAAGLLS